MKKSFRIRQFSVGALILGIILGVYSLVMLLPFFWGIITSFRAYYTDYLPRGAFEFPKEWVFDNYKEAFVRFSVPATSGRPVKILEMYWWAILYAGGGAFVHTFVTCVVAYVVCRFPCKFSKIIYGFVVFTMSLHIVGSLPSELQIAKMLGCYNNMLGMYFMKANFITVYFLIFCASFSSLPSSLTEAAEIDGAGNLTLLFKISVPLVKNVFISVFLLFFISYWNDYQTPMLYIPEYPTIAYGIFRYCFNSSGSTGSNNIPTKLAGCMFLLIPMLALFCCFNKRLLAGLSAGGVKE